MRRLIYIFIIGLLLCSYTWADGSRYASKSLLSEGKWVKIRVDKTGIYKLSYADLKNMGFSDPSKVSVHGYGGWPLDEDFSKEYIDDVPSTPVWRGSDYLLFYGKGPVKWEYDSSSQTFVHTNNPYSLYGYYFVTDATPTNDMTSVAQASGATNRITTYDDYLVHEQELVSLAKSGRELYGEDFSGATPRTLSTFSSIPGITNEDAKVTMSFVSKVTSGTGVASLSINQSNVLDVSIRSNREEYVKALEGVSTAVWKGEKSEKNSVVVSYNSASHNNVRLNYVRLHFKRTLQPYGAYTFFRSIASIGNVSRFVVQGANANTLVFDVTDDGLYVMLYTQWNRKQARLAVATSRDLQIWEKYGPAFAKAYGGRFFDEFSKSASIVTKLVDGKQVIAKIDGKYWMYWGEKFVNVATSTDLINWEPMLDKKGDFLKVITPREGKFDSDLTECGPPAIMTDKGILLLYNGKNKSGAEGDTLYTANSYCAGQALFDAKDPTKLIDRLDKPFYIPESDFEKSGQYPAGTVFIEGLVFHNQKWYLYYGCADSRVAVAVYDPFKK